MTYRATRAGGPRDRDCYGLFFLGPRQAGRQRRAGAESFETVNKEFLAASEGTLDRIAGRVR